MKAVLILLAGIQYYGEGCRHCYWNIKLNNLKRVGKKPQKPTKKKKRGKKKKVWFKSCKLDKKKMNLQ